LRYFFDVEPAQHEAASLKINMQLIEWFYKGGIFALWKRLGLAMPCPPSRKAWLFL